MNGATSRALRHSATRREAKWCEQTLLTPEGGCPCIAWPTSIDRHVVDQAGEDIVLVILREDDSDFLCGCGAVDADVVEELLDALARARPHDHHEETQRQSFPAKGGGGVRGRTWRWEAFT